jgi:ribose transport system permease protein
MREPDKGTSRKQRISSFLGKYSTLLGLAAIIVLFTILQPNVFLTFGNIVNILNQIALVSIISAGLTVVMVMGEFDLSIGTLSSFAGCLVVGQAMKMGTCAGVAVGIAAGAAVGLLNGSIVIFLGVSAFIVTIAMSSVLTGFTYWYTGGATIFGDIPEAFLKLARGNLIPGISNMVVIMLVLLFLLWLLLEHTAIGRQMYAVGGNPVAARYSGINIAKCKIVGFIICSAFAAIGGILLSSRIGAGHPTGGETFLLDSFTAVFLGAATLKGGKFHILGTLVGALLIGVVTNGLTIMNVQYYFQFIFSGLILILAISASGMTRKTSV